MQFIIFSISRISAPSMVLRRRLALHTSKGMGNFPFRPLFSGQKQRSDNASRRHEIRVCNHGPVVPFMSPHSLLDSCAAAIGWRRCRLGSHSSPFQFIMDQRREDRVCDLPRILLRNIHESVDRKRSGKRFVFYVEGTSHADHPANGVSANPESHATQCRTSPSLCTRRIQKPRLSRNPFDKNPEGPIPNSA